MRVISVASWPLEIFLEKIQESVNSRRRRPLGMQLWRVRCFQTLLRQVDNVLSVFWLARSIFVQWNSRILQKRFHYRAKRDTNLLEHGMHLLHEMKSTFEQTTLVTPSRSRGCVYKSLKETQKLRQPFRRQPHSICTLTMQACLVTFLQLAEEKIQLGFSLLKSRAGGNLQKSTFHRHVHPTIKNTYANWNQNHCSIFFLRRYATSVSNGGKFLLSMPNWITVHRLGMPQ